MKALFIAVTAFVLTLSILSSITLPTRAKVEVQPSTEVHSVGYSKSSSSSHQALNDLQAQRKNPSKQVDSCFRAIPPSKSNPSQNKHHPPCGGGNLVRVFEIP